VVSDGHEFILGSFTNKSMPIHLWDALDVVVLTGITRETNLEKLPETSSQVAIMDLMHEGLPYDAYRIDFEPAFEAMFSRYGRTKHRFLYLDSAIASSEQAARLAGFKRARARARTRQELKVISVNQELGDPNGLDAVLESYAPDFVCGYIHHSWLPLIAEKARTYPYALDSDRSSFNVDSAAWMRQVLTDIYASIEDRKSGPHVYSFPASFRP
jgi:hypothetical protein